MRRDGKIIWLEQWNGVLTIYMWWLSLMVEFSKSPPAWAQCLINWDPDGTSSLLPLLVFKLVNHMLSLRYTGLLFSCISRLMFQIN